ncbi:MAG: ABC transporter permease, partial [Gammaproteobacteria bacterium]|nr:ABC transporter permease [Gammaproteobacteria bacterium]
MSYSMLILQAWRQLIREWRSGELYVLFFAMVVAVAAVSSVGFFTDRIQRALSTQANELLGADLLLNSDKPFASDYFAKADSLGLKSVRQLSFPSMVMSENGAHLGWL